MHYKLPTENYKWQSHKVLKINGFLFALCALMLPYAALGQVKFNNGSHLSGLFWDYSTHTASEALGKNSVTLPGIQSAWENPASIGLDTADWSLAANHINGHPFDLNAQYIFLGGHLRLGPKVLIGVASHGKLVKDPVWTTVIANRNFDTDRRSERAYSSYAAYQPIPELTVGLGGHIIREIAIEDVFTIEEVLFAAGATYENDIHLLGNGVNNVFNEHIHLGISLMNLTMKGQIVQRANDSVFQYRDMPAILRGGAAYSLKVPVKRAMDKLLKNQPTVLRLTTFVQYTDWLQLKSHNSDLGAYNSMISIGEEALFYEMFFFRLGYFYQHTASDSRSISATKDRRRGMTGGMGCLFQTGRQLGAPFNIQFDLTLQPHPDYLREEISTYYTHPDMRDDKLMLAMGLKLIPVSKSNRDN